MVRAGIEFFESLKLKNPTVYAVKLRLGELFLDSGDYGKGLSTLRKALQPWVGQQEVQGLLGKAYLALDKPELAFKFYRSAIDGIEAVIHERLVSGRPIERLVSLLESFQLQLAEGLIRFGHFQRAKPVLSKLSERIPDHPKVIEMMDVANGLKVRTIQ